MIIVRLLSPEPVGWVQHHQLYSGVGADIVMESIAQVIRAENDCLFGLLVQCNLPPVLPCGLHYALVAHFALWQLSLTCNFSPV